MEHEIIQADPKSLKLLENNARFMKDDQYDRLVENIERDEMLSSVPFAALDSEGNWEVLSGNHRVRAAIDAGLEEISVMVTHDDLSKDQKIAIQLSHNSIVGEDDPTTLAGLYGSLEDIDMKLYSGLDDSILGKLPSVEVETVEEVNTDSRLLLFVFLPHELKSVTRILDEAMTKAPSAKKTYIGDMKEFDRLTKAMDDVEDIKGVRNRSTALRLILGVFENHKDDLRSGHGEEL